MTDKFESRLYEYWSKCMDGIIIFIKFLKYNNHLFDIKSIDENVYIYGSSIDYFMNGRLKTHRMQDLDILLSIESSNNFRDDIMCYCSKDVETNRVNETKYSSTLLKYQGIHKVFNFKFKSMKKFFVYIQRYIDFIPPDFDYSIEEEIKDVFYTDYVFLLDICSYNLNTIISPYYIITKYNNSLLSSKKGICNVLYDFTIEKKMVSFDEIKIKLKVANKKYIPYYYKNPGKILKLPETVSSLIYYFVLINKIFGMNGLKDNDMNLVRKLPKEYDLYKDYNTTKIIFNIPIIYRFVYVKELLSFPPTINLRKIINRLNIKKDKFIHRWFNLLERIFGIDNILFNLEKCSIMKLNDFFEIIDEYKMITVFKELLGHIRSSKINECCQLCLEKYTLNTPLHLCKNGHATHLCCSINPLNKYLMSLLRRHNSKNLSELKDRQTKMCPICREDHYDARINTELLEYNHIKVENSLMSGIVRSGDSLLDFGVTNKAKDLFIHEPHKVSVNLYKGNSRNYLNKRYQYLTNSKM